MSQVIGNIDFTLCHKNGPKYLPGLKTGKNDVWLSCIIWNKICALVPRSISFVLLGFSTKHLNDLNYKLILQLCSPVSRHHGHKFKQLWVPLSVLRSYITFFRIYNEIWETKRDSRSISSTYFIKDACEEELPAFVSPLLLLCYWNMNLLISDPAHDKLFQETYRYLTSNSCQAKFVSN